ncbi:MAG: TnpV protein, partial [Clostridia bacterium]|nr:TnpV protein [Clostridia bacterium]
LMKQMAKKEGLTEALKAQNMMAWVQGMNNLKSRVQEIVLTEVVYQR